MTRLLPLYTLAALAMSVVFAGCARFPTSSGMGFGGGEYLVCDDLGADADAQKIEAFLDTSARFEAEAYGLAAELEHTCDAMAEDLGVDVPSAAEGELQVAATCGAVADEIESIVTAAYPADGSIELVYEPPVCAVNLDAMASCVARCDANLSASSDVVCAESRDGAYCSSDSVARADAQCEATCEAEVNITAECTEPSLTLYADAALDLEDQVRLDVLIDTLDESYPRLLALEARLQGLAESGADLVTTFEGAADATGRLGARAMACFADSMAVTADSLATVQVSVSVSVEVSASVGATAG